jgi:hypothetical protein
MVSICVLSWTSAANQVVNIHEETELGDNTSIKKRVKVNTLTGEK